MYCFTVFINYLKQKLIFINKAVDETNYFEHNIIIWNLVHKL